MKAMKKMILTTIILLVACPIVFGQPGQGPDERRERIQSLKIAYITEKLNLTPQEAQVFWPVFNEYEARRNEIEESLGRRGPETRPDIAGMSDSEVDKFITDHLNQEYKLTDLKKEYYEKLKEVLPIKKILKLFEAEESFKRMLLERLQRNQQEGPPMQRR